MDRIEERQVEKWKDMKIWKKIVKRYGKYRMKGKLNSEMIWKIWKKSKLKCEMIWINKAERQVE